MDISSYTLTNTVSIANTKEVPVAYYTRISTALLHILNLSSSHFDFTSFILFVNYSYLINSLTVNLIFVWPCIIDINNKEDTHLDATITVYW
jgi:hypothetical protein